MIIYQSKVQFIKLYVQTFILNYLSHIWLLGMACMLSLTAWFYVFSKIYFFMLLTDGGV